MATLFVCGDVMTGRGIDQVLPHPSDPRLYEPYVRSAREYVALAEAENGPVPRPVGFDYVWGDALEILDRERPDARIANLETAVTTSDEPWPGKGIHYRMHPDNVPCLAAARLDCCVLANNHVMDWGRSGLEQTLETLEHAGLRTAGAGRDADAAAGPAAIPLPGGSRALVYAFGAADSGVPAEWAAAERRSGVDFLGELSRAAIEGLAGRVALERRPGDIVVASLHWGGNWGYAVPRAHRDFAHGLIDVAGVDLVHGHSSHHPMGIELHAGRPILYGCGDFLNDYEGISGYQEYQPDLCAMYFVALAPESGRLERLEVVPMRIRRLRVERAPAAQARWLAATIERESARLGTRARARGDGRLVIAGKEAEVRTC
ncbi:MAG TPA: CapA family protein [Usitatibacter sp.]|nr:CapA family protein [Usitatibacter sp.]